MKFGAIFRFELGYQLRRVTTWLFFAILGVVAFKSVTGNYLADARRGDFLLNSPFVIAATTVLCSLLWLLVAAAVAGSAAARDVQTRMDPLIYTAPVSKAEYLGGRFLAAFATNALILLAVPAGIVLGMLSLGVEPEIFGPPRPAAYLSAYAFIALPNAFAATAIQFSLAAMQRRVIASYLGSMLLFFTGYIVTPAVGVLVDRELGKLLDPIGMVSILTELAAAWTPIEKNTRLVVTVSTLLWNRLLWVTIALGTLAVTHRRFRFGHPTTTTWWSRIRRRRDMRSQKLVDTAVVRTTPISVPRVPRTIGVATHARQTLAIAWRSFGRIAKSRGGLILLTVFALLVVLAVPWNIEFMGVPLIPRTGRVLGFLTAPLTSARTPWIIVPLLTILYAGEVVWREREAGLSEITDAAPVPEWVLFLGRFLGLSLVLVAWVALLTTAGVLVQVRMGYYEFEIGRYLQVLFGLQLADYVLFALLALVIHGLANEKHIGYLVALVAYGCIVFASTLGVEHHLLIYGSGPGWSYTDMRGFGPSLGPWLWFKLYWTAWALLLAVAAKLLWVRGKESGLGVRLLMARRRFTRPTAWTAATLVGLVIVSGGFIFYNTHVLNEYRAASDRSERSAEYERSYGRYRGIAQPWLTGINLNVEIYPERRVVEVRGTYHMENSATVAIDSIHVATDPDVETGTVSFDRPAARVLADEDLGYRIYALKEPLQPGDSLRLDFEFLVEPHGFGNRGADASITANSTYFTNQEWLPAIGYQAGRELSDAGARRVHGLVPRPVMPSLYDVAARQHRVDAERIAFDAVVGTADDQVAVAPGELRRTWTEGGRRYFHYVADAPIQNEYAFFSADYAVHEARWNDVAIQIFHHPGHNGNLDRMVRSVEAALDYNTERFGPYPYSQLRFVERPGNGFALHADAMNIAYDEGFSLMNPDAAPRGLDLPFSVVAHEVSHQWGGTQIRPAYVEGSVLLVESIAQYSAMRIVESAGGPEQLRLLLDFMRTSYEVPRTRAGVPLIRAADGFLAYRKGPFALYALSEYIGEEPVDEALRRLLEAHDSGAPLLPTSLDLMVELRAVAPDSLQYLLHDLFEANTFWDLAMEGATAEQTEAGTWQVTLNVRARKVVVDSAGVETPVPIDDWVEIGVLAPAEGEEPDEPLYLQMHRIRSTRQTITVTVERRPVHAGIDPRDLLLDREMGDNIAEMQIED